MPSGVVVGYDRINQPKVNLFYPNGERSPRPVILKTGPQPVPTIQLGDLVQTNGSSTPGNKYDFVSGYKVVPTSLDVVLFDAWSAVALLLGKWGDLGRVVKESGQATHALVCGLRYQLLHKIPTLDSLHDVLLVTPNRVCPASWGVPAGAVNTRQSGLEWCGTVGAYGVQFESRIFPYVKDIKILT